MPWNDEQKPRSAGCNLCAAHALRPAFSRAGRDHQIIEHEGVPAGRLYVDRAGARFASWTSRCCPGTRGAGLARGCCANCRTRRARGQGALNSRREIQSRPAPL